MTNLDSILKAETLLCQQRSVQSVQFSSVAQSCPTLCDPMYPSTPGLPSIFMGIEALFVVPPPFFCTTFAQWLHMHLQTLTAHFLSAKFVFESPKIPPVPATCSGNAPQRVLCFICNRLGRVASLMAQMIKNLPAMQETLGSVPGLGDPLEQEGMATHSIILALRIPWTEEPGGLQSMGSQRVRHYSVTKPHTV